MSIRAKFVKWTFQAGEDTSEEIGEADLAACPRQGEIVGFLNGEEHTVRAIKHLVGDRRHNVEVHV